MTARCGDVATRVIVVGAGIAGLTAAHVLNGAGMSVTVLEALGRAGGRMTTDNVNGFLVDRGAQFLSSEYRLLLALADELGLEGSLRETSPWTAIVRDGNVRTLHAGNPLAPLTSGLLKPASWLRLGRSGWRLRRSLATLALNDYSRWAPFDTESVTAWVDRTIDPSVTEYLFEPMLQGFYFQEPELTSRSLATVLFAFGWRRSRTLTLAGGIGTLPEALAARLDVKLDTPVLALEHTAAGVTVTTAAARLSADYVILAIPAPAAQRLYAGSDETSCRLLATRYSSTINVAIMTDEAYRLPAKLATVYGLLIPRTERRTIAGIGIESNKGAEYAARGQLLNIMLSHAASESMRKLDDATIARRVTKEAEAHFPGLSAHAGGIRVYRWNHAEPYSPVGRAGDLLHYRSMPLPADQRVILAGDYMSMPFTEGAAESGRWAAERVRVAASAQDRL
ncbi:MAG: NAD(P)/FAD-dependent oxidoreductase [Candidatus Velthaea sp.]